MIGYELKLTYTKEIAYRNTVSISAYPEPIFKDSRSDGKQRTGGYSFYFILNSSEQVTGFRVPGKPFISYNKQIYDWVFKSDII